MEINRLLQQIDLVRKECDKLKALNPQFDQVFWSKFQLEFNYNSNHIEGNTLTYGHTEIFLKSGDVVGKYNLRELEEMKAHSLALTIINDAAKDSMFEISEKFIKEINQIILVEPFYKEAITPDGQTTRKRIEPGVYKQFPNSVRLQNGNIFNYASPQETPILMGELIDWLRKEEKLKELHPVQIAAIFHYRFVVIHPFDDSNGRTSRLLMNFILLKNGYAPLVIESKDKKNYLIALNEADGGNLEAFTEYITNLSLRWQQLYEKALKGEEIQEKDDFEKEVEILKRNLAKNKGPKTAISKDILRAVLIESLLPLFKSIENKLDKLRDLFSASKIDVISDGRSSHFDNINDLQSLAEQYAEQLRYEGLFQIVFTYEGFKKAGTNTFTIYPKLTIDFRRYYYKIQINNINDNHFEKLYDEILSAEEIDAISQQIANLSLAEIKQKTK